ncbi:hypothetical protein M405DRAFT_826749, partial [Rhizopogon salebrosus TDB-379]
VHQRSAHGSFTSRPAFEKIPGFKMPIDPLDISPVSVCPQHGYQCPDKIPFGYRPIYERILEAELPADPLDVTRLPILLGTDASSTHRSNKMRHNLLLTRYQCGKARLRKFCRALERYPSTRLMVVGVLTENHEPS